MSLVVAFEVRSELAHFRRPDTLGTHATYPIPTRTALRGLIAAVLGEEAWSDGGRVGLRLLGPVRTVAQQMSYHGKKWEGSGGGDASFHRLTSVELVVQPHYRVYTTGPHADRRMGERAPRLGQAPTLYEGLRPEALATALYIGAEVRALSGQAPLVVTSTVRERSIDQIESIERSSVDYYASVRSLYRQHRNNEIRNGKPDVKNLPDF